MTERFGPDELIKAYGSDTPVVVGQGRSMTLGQALLAEKAFCEADPSRQQDPELRLAYLARMLLEAGSLRPEHEHFISQD